MSFEGFKMAKRKEQQLDLCESIAESDKQRVKAEMTKARPMTEKEMYYLFNLRLIKSVVAMEEIKTSVAIEQGQILPIQRDKNGYFYATDGTNVWRERFIRKNLHEGKLRAQLYG